MFEIFIRRPILSGVISVVIVFLGLLAINSLPITQFPDIVPPSVTVTARYTGANADVMAKTVATPLERAINGVPGMTYMTSVCTNDGMSLTTIYFKVGTDPDVASVNVQNRVTTVLDELPEEVIRAGVITEKEVNSMLMYLNIMSSDSTHTEKFVYNFADINILRELKRIDGVGFVEIMGSRDYAMRVWLNPNRLAAYNMSPQEVTEAIRSQNIEAAPGKTGISSDKIPQQLQYVLQYSGKFSTPEEYGEIVLKALPDGSVLRLKDVATIEFDSEDYNMISMTDGKPSASIMIKQRPGSNAREVIQQIKAKMEELKETTFAPGMEYNISYDVSRFLDASISVVLKTLLEAFILVFIVVYLFLQDFRSTLIPAIAVPVSLIGTFFFMQMLGFSINMLTLFALVLAIGIVVFVILVIINFMVITKGAGRIAEVGARFVLDGMPGKQMAIDADLNAGLIGEDEAKKRRSEVTQEADFYGSMDGASKFVRGDAIAGILIMVINIVGGLLVGVLQHGMSMGHAAESYTLLTIGDGLVAQIPALVISTAAGVIVTRVSTDQDVGEQMVNQLFSNPSVMLLSAAVLGLLGLVPGMPNLVFLLFTAGLLGLAWWIRGREQKAPAEPKPVKMAENNTVVEATWNDVQLEDSLGMEVGYRLIPMVDFQQDGELLGRIRSIRKKFAQEMGFLPPVVHIRDNMDLQPARYRILMKGVEIGSGDAYPGRWLAINPGTAAGTLPGEATVDPAFGLNAIWIESALKEQAQIQGYTVVEASTVVATHLNHLISQHAAELFGRQEAQQLLDRVAQEMPKLTEDLVPGVVTLTTLHKVLQNLLDEKVPIRDMRTILETLAEHAPIQSDPHELTAVVRVALGRAITQQWFPGKDEVHVIGLDTPLERLLLQALQGGGGLEPGLADRLLAQTQEALSRQEMLGAPPVLLVNHALRPLLSRFLRRSLPQLVVLSNLELSDNRHIRMTATIGGK